MGIESGGGGGEEPVKNDVVEGNKNLWKDIHQMRQA